MANLNIITGKNGRHLEQNIQIAMENWIRDNFGDSEANDPSYNLEYLADAVAERMVEQFTILEHLLAERQCGTCRKTLPLNDNSTAQVGWFCCDEYFDSEECLKKSFEGSKETWEEHYSEDGDCYYTEWEVTELIREAE